ncbi:cation:proton antiporter [Gallaecimonas sp. GXIMD4217]|uniref:cation:proton antiporter domain-containing protein n=1 Tax=Gallaecimonas sp. GXIMD4217 TaxID=3131927 RepID=UPI00311AC6DB
MSHSIELALAFLLAAVIAVPLFKRLAMGPILAYLAVGLLLGPSLLGLVDDPSTLLHFSELGVILMLFLLGLELSPQRVLALRGAIFGLGLGQLLLTLALLSGLGIALGLAPKVALVAAAALSLSSTAFAVQLMSEHNLLASRKGQDGFAVLLLQDLAVVPLLLLVAWLAPGQSQQALAPWYWILAAFVAIAAFARFGLAPLIELVVAAKVRETLTALALLLVLGSAWLMASLGLSAGMGAFLAGMLLANSSYRHQLHVDIEPFKGLLLGLFFMSIGMMLNLELLITQPLIILAGLAALLLAKVGVLWPLARLRGHGNRDALLLAVLLAEGGEFAFVLVAQASAGGLLSAELGESLILVVGLSMVVTPWLFQGLNRRFQLKEDAAVEAGQLSQERSVRVIIAGFGRFGQMVGRMLTATRIPFVALDKDASHISLVRRYGAKIFLGNAAEPDLLAQAHADEAQILVIAVDDKDEALAIVRLCQARYPHLQLVARAFDRIHAHALHKAGVEQVFRETFASGLEATEATLRLLGIPEDQAHLMVGTFRKHDERMLATPQSGPRDDKSRIKLAQQGSSELAELLRKDFSGL